MTPLGITSLIPWCRRNLLSPPGCPPSLSPPSLPCPPPLLTSKREAPPQPRQHPPASPGAPNCQPVLRAHWGTGPPPPGLLATRLRLRACPQQRTAQVVWQGQSKWGGSGGRGQVGRAGRQGQPLWLCPYPVAMTVAPSQGPAVRCEGWQAIM